MDGLSRGSLDHPDQLGELSEVAFQPFDGVSIREPGERCGISYEWSALRCVAEFVELSRKGPRLVDGQAVAQRRPFGAKQAPQFGDQLLPLGRTFGRRGGYRREGFSRPHLLKDLRQLLIERVPREWFADVAGKLPPQVRLFGGLARSGDGDD